MGWFTKNSDATKIEVTVSTATLVRVMVSVVLVLTAIAALNRLTSGLIIVGVAFFLALAFNAPVHWLASRFPGKLRGSRKLGTSAAFVIILAVLAVFLWLLVPAAINQTTSFVQSVPDLADSLSDPNTPIGSFVEAYSLQGTVDEGTSWLAAAVKNSSTDVIAAIGGGIVTTLITIVLVFMMLVEGPHWLKLGRLLMPVNKRSHATELTTNMYRVIKGYVNGQVLLAFVAAVVILSVMAIIGIPFAGALAVIVFFAALIPMIGHYIAASIVTLVALTDSLASAVIILGFYILYQQVENYFLQPKIQANATNMSPLLVFVAVILGANFGGLLGALVAIPVMGCLRILVLDYVQSRGIITRKEEQSATGESK